MFLKSVVPQNIFLMFLNSLRLLFLNFTVNCLYELCLEVLTYYILVEKEYWLDPFNPLRLQYVILRTRSQNRCDSCMYIYVHRLCDRNMGLLPASNRHFTVSPHELFTCFQSEASITQHVYQVGRKVEFARSCLPFLASFGKLRLSDQVQFIAWHGIQRQIIWIFCRESEVSG